MAGKRFMVIQSQPWGKTIVFPHFSFVGQMLYRIFKKIGHLLPVNG
jgi:hypothetical protein